MESKLTRVHCALVVVESALLRAEFERGVS